MKTKTRSILALRPLALTGAAALLLAAFPARAHAGFLYTLSQVGTSVVATGSGTLNTTALTLQGTSSAGNFIAPKVAFLSGGASGMMTQMYAGIATGPAAFGTGGFTTGTGTGNQVEIDGVSDDLYVPTGYVSGSALSNTTTFANATFTSLGFTPGTYTYTWGTGANADSLTITGSVPEPSTWALLGLGVGALGLTLRQRRRRAA